MTAGNQTISGIKNFNTNLAMFNSSGIYPLSVARDTVQTQPWIALESTVNNRYTCGLGYDGATIMRFFVGEAAANGSSLTTAHIRASLDWNGNMFIGNPSNTLSSGTLTTYGPITSNGTTKVQSSTIQGTGVNTYTIPAIASSNFILSEGAQTINGVKTFGSAPVLTPLTASQAVVTDASKNLASLQYATTSTASTLVQRDAFSDIYLASLRPSVGIYLPNPTGGSVPVLDHYEEYDASSDGVYQGIWASNQTATINFIRIGRQVTIVFTQINAAATISSVITWSGFVKTRFQPVIDFYGPAVIINNSSTQNAGGRIKVSAVGVITIGASSTGGNFTASGNGGIAGFSVTYFTS
jgi:hypothetical protein